MVNLTKFAKISTLALSFSPLVSHAASRYQDQTTTFIFEQKNLKSGMKLPVKDSIEILKMPKDIVSKRLREGTGQSVIEPLTVTVRVEREKIASIANSLATEGNARSLEDYLVKKAQVTPATDESPSHKSIAIDQSAKDLLKVEAISELYQKPHHNLIVEGDSLSEDKPLKAQLIREVSPFLSVKMRDKIAKKINNKSDLDTNKDLLPDFARKMVKKFIPFRGPNCFHAALSFQSPKFTSSSLINVKEEYGYHRAMINYDELWKTLNELFYEVSPEKSALVYGDMLVFFDVPMGKETLPNDEIDFRWIRHTATYLFNGYTFSKGSKSSNTPYAVRTVQDEWKTWAKFTKNLGVKVYRRAPRTVSHLPPMDQIDWLY